MIHDFTDHAKILDVAIRIAKEDGISIPSNANLEAKSFAGASNYFLIDLYDRPLYKINIKRIKKYLDRNTEMGDTTGQSNLQAKCEQSLNKDTDRALDLDGPSVNAGPFYKINTDGFLCSDWLNDLQAAEKTKALGYIIALHHELDGKLISELLDNDENCLLKVIDANENQQTPLELAAVGIYSLYLEPQELYFGSKEVADAFSLKLIGLLECLDLVRVISGVNYLNLEAINPEHADSNYTNEMQELIALYHSFLPKNAGLMRL